MSDGNGNNMQNFNGNKVADVKRAVAAVTTRAMARAARVMATASERVLTRETKRATEMEGEGNGDGNWWGTKRAMVRVATNVMVMVTTRALAVATM